jgi:hypothetical protein
VREFGWTIRTVMKSGFRVRPGKRLSLRFKKPINHYCVSLVNGAARNSRRFAIHNQSTGRQLQTGDCSVDTRHIPYGSRLIFPDGTTSAAVDSAPR